MAPDGTCQAEEQEEWLDARLQLQYVQSGDKELTEGARTPQYKDHPNLEKETIVTN